MPRKTPHPSPSRSDVCPPSFPRHIAERRVPEPLPAVDVFGLWCEGEDFLPGLAPIRAPQNIETLARGADQRPFIRNGDLAFGNSGWQIAPRLAIGARA